MMGEYDKLFVELALQKWKERGWSSEQEFKPSATTEEEIAAFERKQQKALPSLYNELSPI